MNVTLGAGFAHVWSIADASCATFIAINTKEGTFRVGAELVLFTLSSHDALVYVLASQFGMIKPTIFADFATFRATFPTVTLARFMAITAK